MPKEEWGVKRVCPTTGKRFYDMGRTPIVSPYTGETVVLETGKGGAQSLVADKSAARAKEAETEEEDLVLDDDIDIEDDDDADLPDDDVLDDDDDEDTVALDDLADVAAEGSDDD
ncbi:TIGR02300 family protein [Hasllibacter sp. MH4015]|uniref:TIGR02300 family protein n=1 Tax=Hasllibacter sp. MH4015 TaxID=2854029 RepID=UPI001CD4933F|nr:TIGR02300 family protein [Hasllibacter sp. MH4015]